MLIKNKMFLLIACSLMLVTFLAVGFKPALAATETDRPAQSTASQSGDVCGSNDGANKAVHISINIGCKGKGNPIMDMLFAFIRFLTAGVGLIIVGSLVYAGIQYTMSRGDPQRIAQAETRIQAT